ncbi:MAG: hypothetical protein ACJAXB_002205 [Candidatus Endobugula sp.]|jgi:hypothetical protein
MPNSYAKAKGRNEKGRFVALPHHCLNHENYIRMNDKAKTLIVNVALQYNGSNNGDLCIAFSMMKKQGWKSKQTLYLAINELLHYGWLVRTRIGGLNKMPNLYAITFHSIDECKGKLDIKATKTPLGTWKNKTVEWTRPERYPSNFSTLKNKSKVQTQYRVGTNVVPMGAKTG